MVPVTDKCNKITARLFSVILCCAFALTVVAAEQPRSTENRTLVFGFLPILSTQKLISRFKPLADHIAEAIGQPVRMETAPNYAEFVRRTRTKRYDLLFTAPHFYYLAQRDAGYRVLVRVGAPTLQAVIVANKKSNITSLNDLKGQRLSTPDALSLGTILLRNKLRSVGLEPDKDLTLVATPTHNASLLSAYKGITSAAGLMIPPYNRASPEIRAQMLVLAKTKGAPHMPIAVSSTLAADKVERISQSLLSLKNDEKGRLLLKHLSWPMGFVKAQPDEYDQLEWVVKELNL